MGEHRQVARIIYREILPGDLKKLAAQSNQANTGGGARDLRFGQVERVYPFLQRLFPRNESGEYQSGALHWIIDGAEEITEARLYPPNQARPNEARLGGVNRCIPAALRPEERGNYLLLLLQETDGTVWPYFIRENSLSNGGWDSRVSRAILDCLTARRRQNVAALGYLDFETGEVYQNGV